MGSEMCIRDRAIGLVPEFDDWVVSVVPYTGDVTFDRSTGRCDGPDSGDEERGCESPRNHIDELKGCMARAS